jgi:hypothetical protein
VRGGAGRGSLARLGDDVGQALEMTPSSRQRWNGRSSAVALDMKAER